VVAYMATFFLGPPQKKKAQAPAVKRPNTIRFF